ncbi:MAG: hypothetical protein AMK69_20385, partial [Nitrospira bacterium SG8_3]
MYDKQAVSFGIMNRSLSRVRIFLQRSCVFLRYYILTGIFIFAACILFIAPAEAQKTPEKIMRNSDLDGDGRISRDEWRGKPRGFNRFDTNGDGYLTLEELRAGLAAVRGQRTQPETQQAGRAELSPAFESVSAQTREPILRVEVGTHNAGIWGMALDPSNRLLVTGSEDRTVRVWDMSDKVTLLRILRPLVGQKEQGHIFAVALSPDGRTVACGGRTGNPKRGDACVYLFDRATGALTRRLGGLSGWVQHLLYTPDGRFLVAVTGGRGVPVGWAGMSIFRLPDYALVAEDRDYGNF